MDAARRDLAESLHIARAYDDRAAISCQAFNLGLADYLGGAPEAGTRFEESLNLARRTGMQSQAAYAVLGLALANRAGAGPGLSARLHGAADHTFTEMGQILEPLEAQLADRDRERLRAEMGGEAFETEYAVGRALDVAQVVAEIGRMGTAAEPAQAPAQAPSAGPGEGVTAMTRLTPRELAVLRLVAQGLSNHSITQRLVISEHTVHRHLANILRKLGVPSRAAATAWAVRAGLV